MASRSSECSKELMDSRVIYQFLHIRKTEWTQNIKNPSPLCEVVSAELHEFMKKCKKDWFRNLQPSQVLDTKRPDPLPKANTRGVSYTLEYGIHPQPSTCSVLAGG